jgi:hypothetical protein
MPDRISARRVRTLFLSDVHLSCSGPCARGLMGWTPPDGIKVPEWWCCRPLEEASVNQVSTIGLDLAKHIFQVHGADSAGCVVLRKKLRRGEVLSFLANTASLWDRHGGLWERPLLGPRDR